MLIIIAPAKTLDFKKQSTINEYTQPLFKNKAEELIGVLRKYKPIELMKLMDINSSLAMLNAERHLKWNNNHKINNSKQALLAFKGEVYRGIAANNYTLEDVRFAQDHLRILSGLYGVLKPLDLIQPYRLEMGTNLENKCGKDLYSFWGEMITDNIKNQLRKIKSNYLINLSSAEYAKVVDLKKIKATVITPAFMEYRHGEYKTITIYAKKARGLMTSFIIRNRIINPEEMKYFDYEGYTFNPAESTKNKWIFTRG